MDTLNMRAFLKHASDKYPNEFLTVVLNCASSHRSYDLYAPENIAFMRLPVYSPELNPAERLWEELREKEFANRVFDSLGAVIAQAAKGMKRLEQNPGFLRSLTGWEWISGSS